MKIIPIFKKDGDEYGCPNCDQEKPGYRQPCPNCEYEDKKLTNENK